MAKMWRYAVAAALFTSAAVASLEASAQPPGRGFEKKDFPRKDFERKGVDRKDGDRPPADRARQLERELQELRARAAEIETQLKRTREGGDAKRDEPRRDEPRREGQPPMGRGPFGPGGLMGSGGFDGPRGPFGPGGPMGSGGFGARGAGEFGPGMHLPLEQMSPEQIKTLIGRLQKALEEKSRGGDHPRKPEGQKGDQPRKPEGAKSGPSQEEVLKRLEKLSRELEELRRSLGK